MNRAFGVELEIIGLNKYEASDVINAAGLPAQAEGYNHSTRDHWKVTTDMTINAHGNFSGECEVVSPILQGADGFAQLKTVCEALDAAGASANKSCGVHVHISAADLNVSQAKEVVRRYAKYENDIDKTIPMSRRGSRNEYCRTLRNRVNRHAFNNARDINRLANSLGSRYLKVNLQPIHTSRYGTIEFRQHSGTVDNHKISNWVKFVGQFIEQSILLADANGDEQRITIPARRQTQPGRNTRAYKVATLAKAGYRVQDIALDLEIRESKVRSDLHNLKKYYGVLIMADRWGYIRVVRWFDQVQEEINRVRENGIEDITWLDGINADVTQYLRGRATVLRTTERRTT